MRLLLAVVMAMAALGASHVWAAGVDKPNLIFIIADDMGVDWISAYGADHPTPHIDRLAQQGVRFSHAWCTPICTPTRLELLTGLYPFRTGWIKHHDVPRWGGKGFDWQRFPCWARVVRDAGYATAIGGKWQVNDFRQHPDALARHGFDEHCVWTGYETGNAPPSDERYWNAYLLTNGRREIHRDQYGSAVIQDFLLDFIRRHRDRPFMVYYPMLEAHSPHVPTPLNVGNPPGSPGDLYAGQVTYVDHLVGQVAATVDELGLAQRTVIVFTCDNGSSTAGRVEGKVWPKGKGQVTNAGAQVPFIVRAPLPLLAGRRAGWTCDDLIDFTDVYPTMVELAGGTMPQAMSFDGRSIVGLLDGTARADTKRTWIYSQLGGGRMVRDQRFLLDSRGGFYDLNADPRQQRDLTDRADAELSAARARLAAVLEGMPADAPPPFAEFGVSDGAGGGNRARRAPAR